jgi:hypothetical protein
MDSLIDWINDSKNIALNIESKRNWYLCDKHKHGHFECKRIHNTFLELDLDPYLSQVIVPIPKYIITSHEKYIKNVLNTKVILYS